MDLEVIQMLDKSLKDEAATRAASLAFHVPHQAAVVLFCGPIGSQFRRLTDGAARPSHVDVAFVAFRQSPSSALSLLRRGHRRRVTKWVGLVAVVAARPAVVAVGSPAAAVEQTAAASARLAVDAEQTQEHQRAP